MHFLVNIFLICFICTSTFSQNTIKHTLEKYNSNAVKYISVETLKFSKDYILLDTREREEYEISKLKNAIWVGYKSFSITEFKASLPDKNTPIVVYCSVGVRSEKIGEKLLQSGYSNVQNLYGGIFSWKNSGNPVYDKNNNETEKVHAYSKQWGKLLTNAEKIYNTKS